MGTGRPGRARPAHAARLRPIAERRRGATCGGRARAASCSTALVHEVYLLVDWHPGRQLARSSALLRAVRADHAPYPGRRRARPDGGERRGARGPVGTQLSSRPGLGSNHRLERLIALRPRRCARGAVENRSATRARHRAAVLWGVKGGGNGGSAGGLLRRGRGDGGRAGGGFGGELGWESKGRPTVAGNGGGPILGVLDEPHTGSFGHPILSGLIRK